VDYEKVKNLFILKDKNPYPTYESTCVCGANYVGETMLSRDGENTKIQGGSQKLLLTTKESIFRASKTFKRQSKPLF